MFTFLIAAVAVVLLAAMSYAFTTTRDVFHPLIIIGPMMLFMYAWMPLQLNSVGALEGFFQADTLEHVQFINLLGVICFVIGCLSVRRQPPPFSARSEGSITRGSLTLAATCIGSIGFGAWAVGLKNIGGLANLGDALVNGYGGGWDESGYIRDAPLMLFAALLLLLAVLARDGFRILPSCLFVLFLIPWLLQAIFASKRGPAFMVVTTVGMGWFLNRGTRPPLLLTIGTGVVLGFLMLFLVSNRGSIRFDSDQDLTTDVTAIVERPDTGNEYIYGAGGLLSSEQRQSFYWGRRYLAEMLIRPIPSAIWPNKYEDFGLPELTHNAGTGEGFMETLGWEGAAGSAPGVVSDLWMEFWWLCLPALFVLGRVYATVWRRAVFFGGVWIPQYTIMSALSIYMVMQTVEAILFRLLMLSVPLQISWLLARWRGTSAAPSSDDVYARNFAPLKAPPLETS
jgi:hypothetical protein